MSKRPSIQTTHILRATSGLLLLLGGCGTDGGSGAPNQNGNELDSGLPYIGGGTGHGDGDDGDGDGTGDGYDGDTCQSVTVKPQRVAPHMLILFDRSDSMRVYKRWAPSVSAVKSITKALDTKIEFGLMAFPNTAGDNCDAATTADVTIGLNHSAAIASSLDGMNPGGYTPTAPSLEAASEILGSVSQDPDAIGVAEKYVLLVTDGAPNCYNNKFPSNYDPVPQSVTGSVDAISQMTQAGIKTYVIGYDTQKDAKLRDALNQMAAAGGTGDTMHRAVENEAGLLAEFQEIAGNAVTCTYALEKPLSDVTKVSVKLDDTPLPLNGATTGWTPTADNRQVTITGEACQALKSVADHTVNIVETCDVVIVL